MKQALIVLAVFAVTILAVVIAAYFGRGGGGLDAIDKGKSFRAKPGTTRKNAIALTSNKRVVSDEPANKEWLPTDEEDDSPLTVKSLSAPSDKERSGPAHDKAMEALNSASPETGIRVLAAALALPHDDTQAAYIYEAMGQLYAQVEPPDYGKSQEAFDEARARAEDPALEQSILLKSVQVLMQGGLDGEAQAQLEEGFDQESLPTATRFRLQLLQGQLEERAGNAVEAERIFQAILQDTLALPETLEKDVALMLARTAGLRLTNLYRENDRDSAAEALAKDLKSQLKTLTGTT